MRDVLHNVISNAIKFTPEGGRVTLDVRADDRSVTIIVRDTGIGIRSEDLPRLFREFEQITPAEGTPLAIPPEGTGLGLVIAQRLVALHGGTIGIESEAGKGTTVTIRLPVEAGDACEAVIEEEARS
jgi:signal transduction histidine kinase